MKKKQTKAAARLAPAKAGKPAQSVRKPRKPKKS